MEKTVKCGICACSDGLNEGRQPQINELTGILQNFGMEPVVSDCLYAETDIFSGTDAERAAALMSFYRDGDLKHIFDISGGDISNGILEYLDFDVIKNSRAQLWGYSDLTAVLNAVYSQTGKSSLLYQIKNIQLSQREVQQRRVLGYLDGTSDELLDINCEFLQGNGMEGVVIGGNIRCFLKLAGTPYMPDFDGKILLLESYGGRTGKIASLFSQLDQMGVFERSAGVVLGTFTEFQKTAHTLTLYELLKSHIPSSLPVAMTDEIGHSDRSKAMIIGGNMKFVK